MEGQFVIFLIRLAIVDNILPLSPRSEVEMPL